ncbi:MAG TPA: efflux RND transporter periplasmic adaptor subunit [Methylocystis sp.]|nr:efflux RND transporter periplasmic adaptor subunit [Methylocystis sp.]
MTSPTGFSADPPPPPLQDLSHFGHFGVQIAFCASDRARAPNAVKTMTSETASEQSSASVRRTSGWRRALLAAALIVAVYLAARFLWSTKESKVEGTPALSVTVATVGKGDIGVFATGLGTVAPIATVNVVTQINGQLTQVAFHEGQIVKKGDFLAQIDPRPYEIMQAQYEGQLVHDQGLLDQSKVDLARYQTLLKQNSIARQTEEDQVFLVKQYEGSVKTDRALIEQQKLNLIYAHIVSPVDGRIGLRLVDPGNYVQTSTNNMIAVVTQLQPITVIFPLPEDQLPDILPQMNAGTLLQVLAFDRADVNQLDAGELFAIDSQIDTTTGMVKFRAKFDNKDNKLFPNQFVNARLLIRTLHDVVKIPNAAIQRGAPGAYAYVVDEQNKVSVHNLSLGPTEGDFTAVNSGVAPGDRVVTEGTDRLREGMTVVAPEAEKAPDAKTKGPAPPKPANP